MPQQHKKGPSGSAAIRERIPLRRDSVFIWLLSFGLVANLIFALIVGLRSEFRGGRSLLRQILRSWSKRCRRRLCFTFLRFLYGL